MERYWPPHSSEQLKNSVGRLNPKIRVFNASYWGRQVRWRFHIGCSKSQYPGEYENQRGSSDSISFVLGTSSNLAFFLTFHEKWQSLGPDSSVGVLSWPLVPALWVRAFRDKNSELTCTVGCTRAPKNTSEFILSASVLASLFFHPLTWIHRLTYLLEKLKRQVG